MYVVTGATGDVGGELVRLLATAGERVTAVSPRPGPGPRPEHLRRLGHPQHRGLPMTGPLTRPSTVQPARTLARPPRLQAAGAPAHRSDARVATTPARAPGPQVLGRASGSVTCDLAIGSAACDRASGSGMSRRTDGAVA
jgi:NAD(P)-dependent dehydrogenase (short-subunit alcohol dehydrogenase family)